MTSLCTKFYFFKTMTLTRISLILLSFLPFAVFAQPENGMQRKTIKWQKEYERKLPDETVFRSYHFEGAVYDENFNPIITETVPLANGTSSVNVKLINVATEPLPDLDLLREKEKFSSEFEVQTSISYRKKEAFASISIKPIRKGPAGYERLVSYQLEISPSGLSRQNSNPPTRTYASNSVLASGDWYKIGILQNGVYRITYQQLKNLGVPVESIDPRNIRLYGNGGGQLPYLNSKFRYDDLQENAILVVGETDGVFNENDYIVFYGKGQTVWNQDQNTSRFIHQINNYADTSYYFLTVDLGNGKRIPVRNSLSSTPTHTVTSFDDHQFHEADLINHLKSGREWYGETFDNFNNTRNFNFNFPNAVAGDSAFLKVSVLGRATITGGINTNAFNIGVNGTSVGLLPFSTVGISVQDNYATPGILNVHVPVSSSTANVSVQFSSADPSGIGWLNFIEWNVRRNLDLSGTGSQFEFRDSRSVGPGNVLEFILSNANSNLTIWDVTDHINVVKQDVSLNGSNMSYKVSGDVLRQFIAFNSTSFLSPIIKGQVDNQNLHGLAQAEMIIITNPAFVQQAEKVADFHRDKDGLRVVVATTHQVFNEFSSGAQDVCAIRDFVKMFYDRAQNASDLPRYLLLYGDASYDNKYRISNNSNLVTSFQSAGSLNQTQTYMSDDFYGLLDDNEGEWTNSEIVDISVGRLPVRSIPEAESAARKIIRYGGGETVPIFDESGAVNPTVFADWRNNITFVGDDQDSNTHFRQSDTLARRMANAAPLLNIEKIYLDAYNQISTPGGQRYPDAQSAIVDRIQRGTLLLTYIGHGGEIGWAHERVLEIDDINGWTNINSLAAFLTATCEFTRVDDPGRTSAGELVFLNPNGGGIALFTTSRLAFSSSNFNLTQKFFQHFTTPVNGKMPTIGEVFERTKVDVYSDQYVRNFLLIGDPALRLAFPEMKVKTNTINSVDVSQPTDTLKALSKITITGEIQDASGQKLNSYNGILYPTIYDKSVTYNTLGNDLNDARDPSYPAPFDLQKNIIYKGKVSVSNGEFSFSFVVPRDIQFQYGFGKLSFYAHNGQTDAAGYFKNAVVGGFNTSASADNTGPEIRLYMNDEKFVRGGLTDANPYLYAIISDSSGINTVGTGIGHDMTAELNNDKSKVIVLNDYYENDLNSYQQGKVKYPYKNLPPGPHTVRLKVWDVFNNSGEAVTEFVVAETAELALDHVLNYPNPFTTNTTFMFEHNKPFSELDVRVQIFTVSGKLVKTISQRITPKGFRSDDLKWDGLDEYGDKIGKGVYIYKLRVRTPEGQYADKFEKLVILR
ncbi:MAG: T9SS C-terminal target domain-containing protein [Bacteroidetes bacterium]|nr:MAG: T9SS C-terminal target domain-containing protein [Bacteroidota bacterium]REK05297.1 MAG: T9SS C-terminal target domain-containing protein [Bacteroidota bacterium]REK32702.1 MAG: T9SS C-terminal target domain-containing protein [Bacteroidota bacterium]